MKSARSFLFRVAPPIALLSGFFCAAQTAPADSAPTQKPGRAAQTSYGKLPLAFEANQGQSDPRVKFLAHGPGYSVFLTSGQMVLALRPSTVTVNADPKSSATALNRTRAAIQINLVGGNPNPAVSGENPQAGKVNYFIGKDQKKWRTNVPTYRQVR